MSTQHARRVSRRRFLRGMTLTGTIGLLGLHARQGAAEPPPETTGLRLGKTPGICIAPQYVADDLLHTEEFADVQYVAVDPAKLTTGIFQQLASGASDINITFVPPSIIQLDAGLPVVLLGGVHVGCYEVFGTDQVRAIRDLKGKRVAVPEMGGSHHLFVASMAQYVGLAPRTDIHWIIQQPIDSIQLLAEGKIDALVCFPPVPQELRAKQIGHVVVSSAADRPWSQYF